MQCDASKTCSSTLHLIAHNSKPNVQTSVYRLSYFSNVW